MLILNHENVKFRSVILFFREHGEECTYFRKIPQRSHIGLLLMKMVGLGAKVP